jgi:hypothetical protein
MLLSRKISNFFVAASFFSVIANSNQNNKGATSKSNLFLPTTTIPGCQNLLRLSEAHCEKEDCRLVNKTEYAAGVAGDGLADFVMTAAEMYRSARMQLQIQ